MSLPPPLRRLTRLVPTVLAASLAATGLGLVAPPPAGASTWPGHPDRSIVRHTVRPGETAIGLAVRYHAWTAELLRLNHLRLTSRLQVGELVLVPVVLSAARGHEHTTGHHASAPAPADGRGWRNADLTRTQVRGLVTSTARHYGVAPSLALAIAWQESGWQQRRVSSTGAVGIMQVMPATGRWMRWYAGRRLHLRDSGDNVRAGVLTLRVLRAETGRDRRTIAAYYQGLGALREHGYYRDTRRYVRSVEAIRRSLLRTGRPV